jgi:hypothetical protein
LQIPKLKLLYKKIFKATAIYLVGIITFCSIYYYLSSIKDEDILKKDGIRSETAQLNEKLIAMSRKMQEAKEAYKLWETLNKQHKKREGLKIDEAKKLFDSLQEKFYLSTPVKIDLSTPIELQDKYKTESVAVIQSTVKLDFRGLTDEYLINVVEYLLKNIPGFVQVKSFTIMKSINSIDNIIINKIKSGERPELANGSITFDWRDFKDIPKLQPPANQPNIN